jgi:hypothetical protein
MFRDTSLQIQVTMLILIEQSGEHVYCRPYKQVNLFQTSELFPEQINLIG